MPHAPTHSSLDVFSYAGSGLQPEPKHMFFLGAFAVNGYFVSALPWSGSYAKETRFSVT